MRLPPNVRVAFGPSRIATSAIALAAFSTATLLVSLPLDPVFLGLVLCALTAWAVDRIYVIGLRRGPRAIVEITVTGDRIVVVRTRDDRLRAGYVRGSSYVGARITTLVWRPDGAVRSRSILILPDMLPADDFRRLRVLLRYSRQAQEDSPIELNSS